jgi:hypothetical protein
MSSREVQIFCPILTKFQLSLQILVKVPIIKFHENIPWEPSRHVRIDTETDGRTDMTQLIVTLCQHSNAPDNELGRVRKEAIMTLFEVLSQHLPG